MTTDRINQGEELDPPEKRAPDRPRNALPPDNPGAPEFPSRAESRARLAELEKHSGEETEESQGSVETRRKSSQDSGRDDDPVSRSEDRESDEDENLSSQRRLGEELANAADKNVGRQINETLDRINPRYSAAKSAYSENCTGVVQANELQRRCIDAEAGPLESHLRKDQGGPGGRSLDVIEDAWNRKFTDGTKADIEAAFNDPGARGIVYIQWHGNAGAHVFNVENVTRINLTIG